MPTIKDRPNFPVLTGRLGAAPLIKTGMFQMFGNSATAYFPNDARIDSEDQRSANLP